MRFSDSWWEHVPMILRYARFFAILGALAVQHGMDYYWE
jgi:hypothetical protein